MWAGKRRTHFGLGDPVEQVDRQPAHVRIGAEQTCSEREQAALVLRQVG